LLAVRAVEHFSSLVWRTKSHGAVLGTLILVTVKYIIIIQSDSSRKVYTSFTSSKVTTKCHHLIILYAVRCMPSISS